MSAYINSLSKTHTFYLKPMDFKSLTSSKVNKEELIKNLLNGGFIAPSNNEKNDIQELIKSSINKGSFLKARTALILGIYFDKEKTLSNIRKNGVFRYSKYLSKKCIVKNLTSELLDICTKLNCLSEFDKKYLKSIVNLSTLYISYNKIHKLIQKEVIEFQKKYNKKSIIKTLLSYVDYLFLSNHYPEAEADLTSISSRTKEEICAAVSYLLFYLLDKNRLKHFDTDFISEAYIKTGEINTLIILTCFFSDLKEFEIAIDNFNYTCTEKNFRLKIIPPNENFEKTIRLGYIKNEIQCYNDKIEAEGTLSIETIVDELEKSLNISFCKFTESNNYPRYRIEIPEPVLNLIIEKFFKPDLLFKEEIVYLSHIFKEQLLNFKDLKNLTIKDNLSLMEFIKIRRVFTLFYLLFTKQIYNNKINSDILLHSLIPIFPKNTFFKIITKLTSIKNTDSFLDLICWKPNSNILFDLQYYPIILLNNNFVIPLTIFNNSNSIRNLFASEYKKGNKNLLSDGSTDPLIDILNTSFKNANIQSYKQTEISSTEIDLFAIFCDTLFLFECKQSLQPVSIYDLRTTYNYIKKAEKQLDRLNQEFSNGNLQKSLKNRYNIDFQNIKQTISCIVLNNRMFNGNTFKYPIRNIHEITNILKKGTLRTNEGEFLLWEKDKLSLPDLIEYFSLNSKLVKLRNDSVSVKTLKYTITNPIIEFDSYYLDIEKAESLLNKFTSKLKKIE